MASALLASRAEPLWGERKVYARKQSNTQTPNPNLMSTFTSTSNPNPNFEDQQNDEIESVSISSDSSAAAQNHHHQLKESVHDGFVTFNIAAFTKAELRDLKKRLAYELQQVQKLRNQIELREMGHAPRTKTTPQTQPQDLNLGNGFVKGKGGKKKGVKRGSSSAIGSSRDLKKRALEWEGQFGNVLEKIMKHKHAWVFNVPVDVVRMGLHDYNAIIKQPMDLGTVKSNLERSLYSNPVKFAEDVRLTFNNALTYNPPGHDVFIMAKDLLARFERLFSPAFKKFQQSHLRRSTNVAVSAQQQQQQQMKWGGDQHCGIADRFEEQRAAVAYHRTPTPEAVARKPLPVPTPREELVPEMQVARPALETSGNGKLPKPKAKDLSKREMTFEEKEKLSLSLEELPQEKMDQVVQIMKRRNAALSLKDDEIEVDIEVLDIETLWELDRFVCNYEKMVSMMKKIEELDGGQKPVSTYGNKSPVSEMTEAVASEKSKKIEPVCVEEDIDIGEDMPTHNFPPVEIEKESSSSGGSSGSDSSSSSDSDSGSSSDSDSDADDAQLPCVESKSSPKS